MGRAISVKKHCQYCASTLTKLDGFGYCKKYDCFSRSGKRQILDSFIKKASDIYTMRDSIGQVSGVVSNFYSKRHREADGVKRDAKEEFGFIPFEVLERMPLQYRHEKWDKNIRW